MAKAHSYIKMVNMMVNFMMVRNMEMENMNLKMDPFIMGIGSIIRLRDQGHIYGRMEGSIWVNGRRAAWMDWVSMIGKMDESILDSMFKISNVDMESICIMMVEFILVTSIMGKCTVKEFTSK